MRILPYFLLSFLWVYPSFGQNPLQYVRDTNADTIWYRIIYLQNPIATLPVGITSDNNGTLSIRQMNPDGTPGNSTGVIFSGSSAPAIAFQKSDTSSFFNINIPVSGGTGWAYSLGSINARFFPRGGVISVNNTVTKSSSYTATQQDNIILMSANSATDTLTLPTAINGVSGLTFTIKKTDSSSNPVVVVGTGGQTIDGAVSDSITTQYRAITVVSNGSVWFKISTKN